MATDALLVLPHSFPHAISPLPQLAAQQAFRTLMLTWLTTTATSPHTPPPSSAARLPFSVTGLQQTVLSGRPAVVVGVAFPQRKRTVSFPGAGSAIASDRDSVVARLEAFLSETSVGDVLQPILARPTVSDALSSLLCELDLLLPLPLHSFLSVQGDHAPLTTPTSFYWHSCYHQSCVPVSESLKTQTKLQTTVCTLDLQTLSDTDQLFSVFTGIADCGLDLAGLRLVYNEPSNPSHSATSMSDPSPLTLALAVRGPDATYRLMDVIGPEDSSLAKLTDPTSLSATYGVQGRRLVQCVRTPYLASAAVARWFGGRACVQTGSVLGVSDPHTKSERRKRQRVRFSESESEDSLPSPVPEVSYSPLISNRPLLTAPAYSKMFLVVSPHVPPSCYSTVLASCGAMGYDIFGIKRVRLNGKRASCLGIQPAHISHFTPSSTPPSPSDESLSPPTLGTPNVPPLPSLILVLARENALLHSKALKQAIVSDLTALISKHPRIGSHMTRSPDPSVPDAFLHSLVYSEEPLKFIGGFSTTPTPSSTQQRLASGWDSEDPAREEISFLAVTQTDSLRKLSEVLEVIYDVKPIPVVSDEYSRASPEEGGVVELLAVKLIPHLSRFHAKQVCPLLPSDPHHHQALLHLTDSPATVFIFRGINSCKQLRRRLGSVPHAPRHSSSLESKLGVILAPSFPESFRLASVFFSDKELFCDTANWPLLPCVPPSMIQDTSILRSYQQEPPSLLSVLVVRGTHNRLLVKVLEKLHRAGFCFVAMTTASEESEEAVLSEATIKVSLVCLE